MEIQFGIWKARQFTFSCCMFYSQITVGNVTLPNTLLSTKWFFSLFNKKIYSSPYDFAHITMKSCIINNIFYWILNYMPVSISVDSWKIDYQEYDTILSLIANCAAIPLYDLRKKIPTSTFQNCNSISLQPLTAHSHWLLWVQPNYSWKRNTAKSCTEYSQNICSVW